MKTTSSLRNKLQAKLSKCKSPYISVFEKFLIGQAMALSWLVFSIWISIPWVKDLGQIVSIPVAIFIIAGLAYIPGYLNAFLLTSLLLDKQPVLKVQNPKEKLTILIAAYNEEKSIGNTLQYIAKQDYTGSINVIVIDNNSTDNTADIVRKIAQELDMPITCLYEPKPGKHHALNAGLKYVKTELLITLDADTLLHKSAIKYLVARMLSSPSNVCAVAGAVLVRNSRECFWTRMQEWDYFLGIASVKRYQGLYQGTLVAQGAFSLYKTELVKQVGGWPDAIGEDIVLTWRFLKLNQKVYFEPLAVAFTEVPARFKHFVRQRNRWARGMIEGLREIKPWNQPRLFTKFLTSTNLVIPYLDLVYTFCWLPGFVLAWFGLFWIVGPLTILVIPLTLISNGLLYLYQKNVFKTLNLRIRKNKMGFVSYIFLNQVIMSPVSVWGYFQELLQLKRVWK